MMLGGVQVTMATVLPIETGDAAQQNDHQLL